MLNAQNFLKADLRLNEWQARSIVLKENELIIELIQNLKHKKKALAHLAFQGIISFKDSGLIGKPLSGLYFEDKASFKTMTLRNRSKKAVFACDCMEATQTLL